MFTIKIKFELVINFILFKMIKNKARIVYTINANLIKKVVVNSISKPFGLI